MKSKRMTAFVSAMAVAATMIVPVTVSHAETTTLTVGTDKQYQTISEAVAKAKELNPQSEADRVTINVDPGDYEEQVRFVGMHYVTLQQTPETDGQVDLHWYYCTGFCAANADHAGYYNPNLDWTDSRTWTGYGINENEEQFTAYTLGQSLDGVSTISYYDKTGKAYKDQKVNTGSLGGTGWFDSWATLVVDQNSTNITVKDFNIVNSIPVMVTQGEKAAHVVPEASRLIVNDTKYGLPKRNQLSICSETTAETAPTDVLGTDGKVDKNKYEASTRTYTSEESAFLARSSAFNERGHAISILGDKIVLDGIRARGNQDSVYVGGKRAYFENCDLIGGTDYIYGGAPAVFNNCKLGAEGMSDEDYGATITAANTDKSQPYGYLFWNCTVYNVRDNITNSLYGRPWGADSQVTFYKTVIDDNATVGASKAGISDSGWRDMSGNKKEEARYYEYDTTNISGAVYDLSKRVVNTKESMGTVLDEWQILEFNPRNYLASNGVYADDWDPMNFGSVYLSEVDSAIEATTIEIPSNEEVAFNLPTAPDGLVYKWESASTNAVVSKDGTKVTVIRPAVGENNIETTVTLYAMDEETGYGDKKEIPVTITPTTNTTDVFNIPVTVTTSAGLAKANDFNITISKNGAVIKTDTVTMPAGETSVTKTVENVPASAEGITYDVAVVSESSDITITSPIDGKTAVTGVTGKDIPLAVVGQIQVDTTVNTGISYTSADGNKTYDLIALAKKNGATSNIDTSEVITIKYTLDVTPTTNGNSYIDILSATPTTTVNTSGTKVPSRFVLAKLGHWNQLDHIDSGAEKYSGANNTENQWLNACGKFTAGTASTVEVTIDYKNEAVTVSGSGSNTKSSYTFASFPTAYTRGKVNMAVYAGGETFGISSVSVTYKDVVSNGEAIPTPVPTQEPVVDFVDVVKYTASNTDVSGGNECKNNAVYKFVDGVDSEIAALFADSEDSTKVDANLIKNYKNYISGTSSNGTHPSIKLTAPKGNYKIYYLGYNHGNNITATIGEQTVTAGAGINFAYQEDETSRVLKVYEMELVLNGAVENGVIKFDSTDSWLPDLYAIVIKYTGALPTPVPTATPTATPTIAPTDKPTETTVPDDKAPAIADVTVKNGNTVVTLNYIYQGVVIAVERENGTLKAVKTANVADDTASSTKRKITIEGIEADEVYVWDSLEGMKPLCDSYEVKTDKPTETTTPVETTAPITEPITVDFTTMSAVPVYSTETGQGFVTKSSSIMPTGCERTVATSDKITISSEGAKITETDGSYLHKKTNSNDGDDYNNGGLIYRIDTGKAGAYRLEVEITGTSADTIVAPTGMDGTRLTGTSNWDNAGEVSRTVSAAWNGSVWTYDFGTGADFVEIEIEPKTLATASAPQTVGVKSIKVTPLDVNSAGDKPTIHIIGDSTQKTYTFNETISAWGQTLGNYFDSSKVNVVNYSMGGRAMKSNYSEGRFDEILISGKEGDFVFIHSAHNDETVSTNRFSRGAGVAKDDLTANNENYNKWLDMYVEAIKARGMTPVLVSAMPRVGSNKYSESALKPNGFNPDSPANMRAKAKSDSKVGFVELYGGAKAYMDLIDAKEVTYIYNNTEAGETPAENAANGANGDGTHYKEAASKQWSRIILQSIYNQSVAATDTYTDKDIMAKIVKLMPETVQNAAKTNDWSAVFPEMASDVSAVGVVPNATKQAESNYYYRNNIEKALQLGLIKKDAQNMFKPNDIITVGDFARGAEKAFGLEENTLTSYTKTYAELSQVSASSVENTETVEIADVDNAVVQIAEAGEGQFTVTVTQPVGGTVTVYNESAFKTATANVPASVSTSAVIADNDCFTFTAPSEIAAGSDKTGVFADNTDISTDYVEFRNNGTKEAVYTAKADGILTVYARTGDNKKVELVDATGTLAAQSGYLNDGKSVGTGSNVYGVVKFNVKAGTTYNLYTRGGTGRLFGVKYESTDYPQSTASLTVNNGDEVRVTAVPDDSYVNKAILVNGETKTTSKEYTFAVTENTTVTAEFTAEPTLVETTAVASDAALTREVMGAILYDAYLAKYGKDDNGDWNKVSYMNQNGGVPSPDDPNYDPNITYEGSPYIPLTGWGALEDLDGLSNDLYAKVKQAYNLGLIRSEQGIARGSIACGSELEPKAAVTRAKAAKSLVFAFILTQPPKSASQKLPNGNLAADTVAEIAEPNADAPSTVIK